MTVRIDRQHQKIAEEYNLDYHIAKVAAIKDEDGRKVLRPGRVRVTITDKITKMKMFHHDRDGRGEVDEVITVHEAIDKAQHTPKPMTPAQLTTHVDMQNSEIAALKDMLSGPEGAVAVEKKCKNIKGKLRQKGIGYPAGTQKNDLDSLRILQDRLDKAEAVDKDELSEGTNDPTSTWRARRLRDNLSQVRSDSYPSA